MLLLSMLVDRDVVEEVLFLGATKIFDIKGALPHNPFLGVC